MIKTNKNFVYVLGITIFGGIFRFYNLGEESFWYDEIIMARMTSLNFGELAAHLFETGRSPLYVLIGQIWVTIFGKSETITRFLSAFFGVISVPLLFIIGKKFFDNKIGLISSLIMSFSLFHIYHSQEHRYYALLIFLTLLYILFLLQSYKNQKWTSFLLYSFCGALVYYTHTLAGLLLYISTYFFIIIEWNNFKEIKNKLIVAQFIILFLISFWLLPDIFRIMDVNGQTPIPWVTEPNFFAPIETLFTFLVGRYWHHELVSIFLLLICVGFFARRILKIKQSKEWVNSVRAFIQKFSLSLRSQNYELVFLLCLVIIPIIMLLILSYIFKPIYVDRYLSISAPAWYILIALILVKINKIINLALILGAYIITIGIAMYFYYSFPTNDQWREASEYLNENIQNGDVVAFAVENGDMFQTKVVRENFSWYYHQELDGHLLNLTINESSLIEQVDSLQNKNNRLWLIQRDWNGITPTGLQALLKRNSNLITIHEFYWVKIFLFNIKK